jgi:hypothetical protein
MEQSHKYFARLSRKMSKLLSKFTLILACAKSRTLSHMFITVSVKLPTLAFDFLVPLSSLKTCIVPVSEETQTIVDTALNEIE